MVSAMLFKYNLFLSYASENKDIADYIVDRIEKRGYKCFIAPRDIRTGAEYAAEIIRGISNSTAVLLVFSSKSDKSHYVLREINSAVSRNRPIIPLRIEDFLPSEAMEFYLGPTHWLDAFPEILDVHLDKIVNIFTGMGNVATDTRREGYSIVGPELIRIADIGKIGMDYTALTMKEMEIDYLCIPSDRYEMNDETEGTFDDWKQSAKEYENDTSILLVKNDEVIGYCDMYPVMEEAYNDLITGKVIIRDSMIDLFCMGGVFDVYIAMVGIVPEEATQANYLIIFDWIFEHLDEWSENDINVDHVGISVYSDMLEKFIKRFGFEYKGLNPAKGKVYEATVKALKHNSLVKKRYPHFCQKDSLDPDE